MTGAPNQDSPRSDIKNPPRLSAHTLACLATCLIGLLLIAPRPCAAPLTFPESAKRQILTLRAADVLDAFGVNTHIPYTDGAYANIENICNNLDYLGIVNVRDGISNREAGSAPLSAYIRLARQGVRFTFLAAAGGLITQASLSAKLRLIGEVNKAVPGSVVAVEGSNEINNFAVSYQGVSGLDGAIKLQQALFAEVHRNPHLAGVAVDYFTGYAAGRIAAGPNPANVTGLADFDTQHPYPNHGQPPAAWLNPKSTLQNEPGQIGKFVYTETGYSTNAGAAGGVNQDVQAKYTLDLLLDAVRYGAAKTYLYQLLDSYPPGSRQGDDGYGLFAPGNVAKPAAHALHNLTCILADGGQSSRNFPLVPFAGDLPGLPASANAMVLEKSNGSTAIVVWSEPTSRDERQALQVSVQPLDIRLELGKIIGAAKLYDPTVSALPLQSFHKISSMHVKVTDHPMILEISPGPSQPEPSRCDTGKDSTRAKRMSKELIIHAQNSLPHNL